MENIFYMEEKLPSSQKKTKEGPGFHWMEFKGKKEKENFTFSPQLLFTQEGVSQIRSEGFPPVEMKAGECILLSENRVITISAPEKATLLFSRFDLINNTPESETYRNYYHHCKQMVYQFTPIPVKKMIITFVEQMIYHLQNGLHSEKFHRLKARELHMLIQAYYTHEEVVSLLYPVLKKMYYMNPKVPHTKK